MSETERTRHRRLREQGRTDRSALFAVLRAGFVCHLGVVLDGTPFVVPTVYGVDERFLYFHGSVASRSLEGGQAVCVTVTHVDGLVLARSVFEHGVNYRSAVIYGVPRALTGPDKLAALRVLSEHAAPGQWDYARRPSKKELAATTIFALPLDEASVKVAEGPPGDGDGPDAELGLWAGVVPMETVRRPPEPDPALPAGIAVPAHIMKIASPDGA
ncbi:pyridoxamine 5'-phosphate oxidase family protein [Actinomadura sp. DC4]|uniref:pyridoxamine 5'-phosphate oxidase family protein n=1 Tax=Actinomadura sp. DC4 TaxID=3055069 RepID=UPI00339D91DB